VRKSLICINIIQLIDELIKCKIAEGSDKNYICIFMNRLAIRTNNNTLRYLGYSKIAEVC